MDDFRLYICIFFIISLLNKLWNSKNLNFFNITVWQGGGLTRISQVKLSAKVFSVGGNFEFFCKILEFQRDSLWNEWRNKIKELKFFMVWQRRSSTKLSQAKLCAKKLVLVEGFNLLVKLLSFQGISPWKELQIQNT